jgi:hypothetical protein
MAGVGTKIPGGGVGAITAGATAIGAGGGGVASAGSAGLGAEIKGRVGSAGAATLARANDFFLCITEYELGNRADA